MAKVVFIVTVGSEVNLFYPIYQSLREKGVGVKIISTNRLCCDKDAQLPEGELNKLNMVYSEFSSYKTKSAYQIIKHEKPGLLIIGSDQEYIRRAFIYASKHLKIPTMLFQVGISSNNANIVSQATKRSLYRIRHYLFNILNKYTYVLRTVIDLKWGLFKIIRMILNDVKQAVSYYDMRGTYGCDYIVVSGSWETKTLIERGVNLGNIYVTGNPLIKLNCSQNNVKHENGKKILLLTSAMVEHGLWTKAMRTEFTQKTVDVLSSLGELTIKIHPIENLADYQTNKAKVIKDIPLKEAVNLSDIVVVGNYSTAILEVSLLRKPVILMNVFNEYKDLPYDEMGLAKSVYNYDELKTEVGKLFNLEYREEVLNKAVRFFNENHEYIDGKATERITNLILEAVN